MSDVHSKEVRSYNMSQIKGKNTRPEVMVRKFLFASGLRYKLHDKNLPGKPDLVFPKYKKVVFIHGCFWHGHEGCKYFVIPKTRSDWWIAKISKNKQKDEENTLTLEKAGWDVISVWECDLKPATREQTLKSLAEQIRAGQ